MRKWILALVVILALPCVSGASQTGTKSLVAAATTIATGAPLSPTWTNPGHNSGVLYIRTQNEVATASLQVRVYTNAPDGQVFEVCTPTAITANGVAFIWIGPGANTNGAYTQACDVPLTRDMGFTFTVTGAGASFDVTSDLMLISE